MIPAYLLFFLFSSFFIIDSALSSGFKRLPQGISESFPDELKIYNKITLPPHKILSIISKDKTVLKGYFYPKNNKKIVIIIHGYHNSHKEMLPFAEWYLSKHDFSVFLPDLRGHGESGGNFVCFGTKDREDIYEWISYLRNMLGDNIKIILHGVSMGAACAIMTGAYENINLCGIISDCSYASGLCTINTVIGKNYKIMRPLISFAAKQYYKFHTGHNLSETDITKYAACIKCPILFIHGEKDDFIPPSDAYKLFSCVTSPSYLYIAKNSPHARSAVSDFDGYEKHVNKFLSGLNMS